MKKVNNSTVFYKTTDINGLNGETIGKILLTPDGWLAVSNSGDEFLDTRKKNAINWLKLNANETAK